MKSVGVNESWRQQMLAIDVAIQDSSQSLWLKNISRVNEFAFQSKMRLKKKFFS